MHMQKFLTAIAAALLMSTAAAYADPITITGNFDVTSSSSSATLSIEQLGGALSNGDTTLSGPLTSLSLALNTPVSYNLFDVMSGGLVGNGGAGGSGGSQTSTIDVLFTGLSDGSAETSCAGGCSATGTLSAGASSLTLSPALFTVDFANGAALQIAGSGGSGNTGFGNSGSGNSGFGNSGSGNLGSGNTGSGNLGSGNTGFGNSGSVTENYTFTLTSDPSPVPEPQSLVLLATGLLGFGAIRWRRRSRGGAANRNCENDSCKNYTRP